MSVQYSNYTDIHVEGSADYQAKVLACLTKIETEWPSGQSFLAAINGTKKRLTIGPRDEGYPSNYCDALAHTCFNLLTRAIVDQNETNFGSALRVSLATAKKAGVTAEFIAKQLTAGLLPVTYDTKQNVGPPKPAPANFDAKAGANLTALNEFVSGARTLADLPDSWSRDLQRLLRPWLPPGRGSACTIGFDPDQTYPCDADPARKNRPPIIGLAHEMVHAWRYMTGKRMNVRTTGFDIEEVIATGFAPYNFEPYSENLFRTQFKDQKLIIRETYSWLPGSGTAVPTSG
ncbi:MAG TPA: M91 family zinc metallopeptidase [Bryobacteraceae bacterium]|nr:M91 family zinc metallopeptidase [Bryobacteraceae bacterium]